MRIIPGARKAVYFVCMANPAIKPARTARAKEPLSQVRKNSPSASKLKARAGMSIIKFKLGKKTGENTSRISKGIATEGAKRCKSAAKEATKIRAKGKSHNFHSTGRSPNIRIATAHQ